MNKSTATKGRSFFLGMAGLAMTSFATGCGSSNAAVTPKKPAASASTFQALGQVLKEAPVSEGTWAQGEPAPHQKKGPVTVQQGKEARLWYFETEEVPNGLTYGVFRLYIAEGDKRLISDMSEGKPLNLYGKTEVGDPGLIHAEWSRTWSFGIGASETITPGTYALTLKAVPTKWSEEKQNRIPSGDPLFFNLQVRVTK